jgi:zeaxanthin glucosyltransferase
LAHFAFIAPPFLGHLNPMLALADELVGRGHRATFLHQADVKTLVRGHHLVPLGASTHPVGHLAGVLRRMARVNGFLGLGGIIRDVAAATDMLARELPGSCRALGIDMIVGDQTEAAAGLVGRHLGLPYVSVANALPLNREPDVPPPFTGWRYNPSDWGRERNRGGYRVSDLLMRRHARVISDYASRWRLGPLRMIEDCASPFAQISQTVPNFDFPRRALPPVFHHVGPLRREPTSSSFRMPARDGRPLVYASLGTLQGGRVSLFRRIAEAARRLDLQLVIAHGGGLDRRATASLPGNPAVYDFVPQEEVLRQAHLAVLHGGLNTVMDALAAAVPIVAIPIAFEQGAIAARLERAGAGTRVGRRFLTAGRLVRAMRDVLSTPSHALAAARLAGEVAAAGGVARAADIIETVLLTGRPVLRDGVEDREWAAAAAVAARRGERLHLEALG